METVEQLAEARNVLMLAQIQAEFAMEAINDNDTQRAREELVVLLQRVRDFVAKYPKAP